MPSIQFGLVILFPALSREQIFPSYQVLNAVTKKVLKTEATRRKKICFMAKGAPEAKSLKANLVYVDITHLY